MSYQNIKNHLFQAFQGKQLTNESEAIVMEELVQIKDLINQSKFQKENDTKLLEFIDECIEDLKFFKKIECIYTAGATSFNHFMNLFENSDIVKQRELEAGIYVETLYKDITKLTEELDNSDNIIYVQSKIKDFVMDFNIPKDILLIQETFNDIISDKNTNSNFNTLYDLTLKQYQKHLLSMKEEVIFGKTESVFLSNNIRSFITEENKSGLPIEIAVENHSKSRHLLINDLVYNHIQPSKFEEFLKAYSYVDEKSTYLNSTSIFKLFKDTIERPTFPKTITQYRSDLIEEIDFKGNQGLRIDDLTEKLGFVEQIIDKLGIKQKINNALKYQNN